MHGIVVAGDEVIITLQVEELLTSSDCEIVGNASSMEEAVEMAKSLKLDLILMDIAASGKLEGIDAFRTIKEELDIPVISLSGYADERPVERAKHVTPFGYIVKPFQGNELKAAIEGALSKRDLEEELNKPDEQFKSEITKRKQAEKALQECKEQYQDFLDNAKDLIQIVSLDSRLLYVNNAWEETFGYRKEEIIGFSIFDFVHPDSQAHCMEAFQRVLAGEEVESVEAEFLNKDGKRFTLEGNCNCKIVDGKAVFCRGDFP